MQATHVGSSEESVIREYRFNGYRMDLAKYELWHGDQLLPVTTRVFDTLAVLISHRDRAVSKEELLRLVWPDTTVSEDSLTQSISLLRRALGDDPTHPKVISTLARRGYKFIAPVEEIWQSEPARETGPTTPAESTGLPFSSSPSPVLPGDTPLTALPSPRLWLWVICAVGMLTFASGILLARFWLARPQTQSAPTPLRFTLMAPETTNFSSGGILSPNGQYLAFVAQDQDSGRTRLWIRSLDAIQPRTLTGTDGASRPFWSPDSTALAFFADGKLKRASVSNDEPVRVIASTATSSSGGSWSSQGVIIFANQRSGLYSVPAAGGTPARLTVLKATEQEVAHRSPQFLPDGEHFLFLNVSAHVEKAGTYLGSLHSDKRVRLIDVPAVYGSPGYLIYVRDHLLMAARFDVARPETRSSPMTIAGTTMSSPLANDSSVMDFGVSASNNGLVALTLPVGVPQLRILDRTGRETEVVDMPVPVHNPSLSPDQKQVLVGSRESDHGVWLVDLDRSVSTRVSSDGMRPLWSANGSEVLYSSDRLAGTSDLYIKHFKDSNDDKLVLRTSENKIPNDWSPDGQYVVYQGASTTPEKLGLWLLPLSGGSPRRLLNSPFNEAQGQISSDGKWIAYSSDETGRWEVYIQSFPAPGQKRIVSVGGGAEPHWRRDGKELFYLSVDRDLMVVSMSAGDPVGKPRALFKAPVLPVTNVLRNQYAVTNEGQQFIFGSMGKSSKDDSIMVMTNWTGLLRR